MRVAAATVTSKGQITIPADVRRQLGIQLGDRVEFATADDGTVVFRRAKFPTLASLRGAAGSLAEPLSWDEMRTLAYEDRAPIPSRS